MLSLFRKNFLVSGKSKTSNLFFSYISTTKGFGFLYTPKLLALLGTLWNKERNDAFAKAVAKEFLVKQREEFSVVSKKRQDRNNNNRVSNSYKGRRSIFHLPCRGQRTHTNARTCKRPKIGMKRIGIGKKKKGLTNN